MTESIDWLRTSVITRGIETMEASLQGHAFSPHSHDTYSIAVTETGVQCFRYRGTGETSLPGEVIIIHPDEKHDGHAGNDAGFRYKILYVEPNLLGDALATLRGASGPLPFVSEAVSHNRLLHDAIKAAFIHDFEPLARDSMILQLAGGLLQGAGESGSVPGLRHTDDAALGQVHDFLSSEYHRVVRSDELERLCGMTRFELARQFRHRYGTSPYRFMMLRRLDAARRMMADGTALADVALACGFADQAHFTRMFKTALGMTPTRYRALRQARRLQ